MAMADESTTTCKRKALKCPECGADGTNIEYLEMIPSVRQIHGVMRDGTIIIDAASRDYPESSHDEKLACQGCGHEWEFENRIDFMDSGDWNDARDNVDT